MAETGHLALINNGIVVNVASVGPDREYAQLKAYLATKYDSVLEVPVAGIGWEEYKKGKLRPPAPSPDCTWDDKAGVWDCPAPPDPETPDA